MDCAATDLSFHIENSEATLDVAQLPNSIEDAEQNDAQLNEAESEDSPDEGPELSKKSQSKINHRSVKQDGTATDNSIGNTQKKDVQLNATEIQESPGEGSKHSEESPVTLNYIKKKSNKTFCVVCNLQILDEDVDSHILEKYHASALRKHACNKIVHKGQRFYCSICCIVIPGKKKHFVYKHIRRLRHLELVEKAKEAGNTNEKIAIPPLIEIPEKVKTVESEKKPDGNIPYSDYVVTDDEKRFFCLICDPLAVEFVWYKAVNFHIKSKPHKAALARYGCEYLFEYEKNSYHCECCDKRGLVRSLRHHIMSDKHLLHVEQERSVAEPEKNPFGTVLRLQRYIFTEETPVVLSRRGKIVETPNESFNCKICGNRQRPLSGRKLRLHVGGPEHAASLAKYGCERIFPEGDEFCCRCCNCGLSTREIAYTHVTSEDHLRNVAEEKTRKLAIENDEKTMQQEVEVTKSSLKNGSHLRNITEKKSSKLAVQKGAETTQQEDSQVSSKTSPKSSSVKKLSCMYVVKVNSMLYNCRICSDEESTEIYQTDVRDHIVGRRHRDALKKYGCDRIVINENNIYYCKRCDSELGSIEAVFLHVKDEKHLNHFKVPYCQNMISNFVLEKNATDDSQCEVDKMILDMTERILEEERPEEAENPSGEASKNDLSLHFISCDPYVLCKGAIKRGTKIFAVKIVKQHADDPYCLICDFEIPGFPAVEDHIMGKCHANSLEQYGCDNIFRKKNQTKIVCRLCSNAFPGIESVYRHIKTNAHLRRVHLKKLNGEREGAEKKGKKKKKSEEDIEEIAEDGQFSGETQENCKQENGDLFSCEIIADETENQKPPQFNTILSSLSADLSRMLANMEVSKTQPVKDPRVQQTKNQRTKKQKNENRALRKKMRFKQMSPDREGGYSCSVCDITLPRKEDVHIHMTSHFSEDFGHMGEDADSVAEEKDSDSETENDNSSDSEHFRTPNSSVSEEKIVYNFSFK